MKMIYFLILSHLCVNTYFDLGQNYKKLISKMFYQRVRSVYITEKWE